MSLPGTEESSKEDESGQDLDPIEEFSDLAPEPGAGEEDPIEDFSPAPVLGLDRVESRSGGMGRTTFVPGCSCICVYAVCVCGGAQYMRP